MAEKNIRQLLHDALLGGEGAVTMEQFTNAFEAIVTQVLAFEKKVNDRSAEASDKLRADFDALKAQSAKKVDADIRGAKSDVLDSVNAVIDSLYKKIESIKNELAPTDAEILAIIRPLLPTRGMIKSMIPPPTPGSPDTGEDIIQKVNNDESDYLIRKGKVEGLEDIEKMVRTAQADVRVFSNSGSFTYEYNLSPYLNGVTKTFALPANAQVITVLGESTPGIFLRTTHYTTTASTITFTSAVDETTTLSAGQTVIILYKIL